jgi:hypothetical protein
MTIDGVEKAGSFFFMFPYNRLIVRRSWHLSQMKTSLFPKHQSDDSEEGRYPLRSKGKGRASKSGSRPNTPAAGETAQDEPVHGPEFQYEEALEMPSGYMAFLVSFGTFSFFAAFYLSGIVSPTLPLGGAV